MRFDDTLETVLSADLGSPQAAQSAWRQLVDLIGRRRAPAEARAMGALRAIRERVPTGVRLSSAKALEYADPPAPLVRLFAVDELPIALPVLRTARMTSAEWVQLLPDLAPGARSVLRNRRDLGPIVKRALETYGPVDFVLPDATPKAEAPAVVEEPIVEDAPEEVAVEVEAVAPEPEPEILAAPEPEPEPEERAPEVSEVEAPVEVAEEATAPITYWSSVTGIRPPSPTPAAPVEAAPEPVAELPETLEPEPDPAPEVEPAPAVIAAPEEDFSFVALAEAAPLVRAAEVVPERQSEVVSATIQSGTVEAVAQPEAIAPAPPPPQGPAMDAGDLSLVEAPGEALAIEETEAPAADEDTEGPFEIADVVARIDAFWRHREEGGGGTPSPAPLADHFRFETDSKGVFRWVDGVSRAALVGLSLEAAGADPAAPWRVDGVASGAFRRRAGFANARLSIDGESDAAGDWLISAIPVFDPSNGRFTGYRGTARRPRVDERAEPARPPVAKVAADSLRQLVHELRTPTNAIAGFAEMIESQMLGPVPDPYRDRAGEIRSQARELLGAIDDLDLAARIDSAALALVADRIALRPVLGAIADDLAPLANLRGSSLALPVDDLAVIGDPRAVERLLARLLATLVSASVEGERIGVRMTLTGDEMVAIAIDRPRALADYPGDSVLGIDDEREDATLLGTGFALRLARNLARELGGALVIGPESLTLRLPAAVNSQVGQAHLN